MGKQLSYILSILFALILVATSACRNTDDLAYYYNNNGTGAGNGNSCCCGCCNNNNNSNTADVATPYCEPEAPELVACKDGTINIKGYKGVTFATEGSCAEGQYVSAADGVMTVDDAGKLLNDEGKSLLWVAQGASSASLVVIPSTIESMIVLPNGTIIGYINSVATTLGKLITVSIGTLGACSPAVSPTATIGHSILWCGERVCSIRDAGVVDPIKTLAAIKVEIPTNAYLTLSQAEFDTKETPLIYATGIKYVAVRTDGLLIDKETCMAVLDKDNAEIAVPRSDVSKLEISGNLLKINDDTWATLSVTAPEKSDALIAITSGNLSAGFKIPIKGLTATMVTVGKTIDTIGVEQNVCVQNELQLLE